MKKLPALNETMTPGRFSPERLFLLKGALMAAGVHLGGPALKDAGVAPCVGPVTDHFDGRRFHNQAGAGLRGFRDFLKWVAQRKRGQWQGYEEVPPGPNPPDRVAQGELYVTFINHATVLIQMDGLNILTDPIWSMRASPVSWAGPSRVRPPGIRCDDLPKIDGVLVSHNHFDHLDLSTLMRLAERHNPRFFVPLGLARLLEARGIRTSREMDWWQTEAVSRTVSLTAVPAQHFSARGMFDRNKTLWGGFVLSGTCGPVYFAGDTALGPHFEQIRERFGGVKVALLPIGAYQPRWFMSCMHISPAEAVVAHRTLGAEKSLAIHFGTFRLGDDGQQEPLEDLDAALQANGLSRDHFAVLDFGEGRKFA